MERLNLLIFIHSLSSGGAERVTANLANYWAGKGWNITIVTMSGMEDDFYVLHPDIRRIVLELDTESANVFMATRNNLRRVYALRAVLRQEKPDVALGMMSTANCLLSMAASGTDVLAIGSERTYPPKSHLGRVWSWLRRGVYPRLSAVVVQTEKGAQWLRTHAGVCRAPVIPNPVFYPLVCHAPLVMPEQIMGANSEGNMLLAAGRLGQGKGFDRLLVAFSELAPVFPDWSLIILGEGACRNELENKVADLGLEKNVFLPGVVGNISEWYEAADLYVLTSIFEGFPNSLAEALAHGLPAISVDCETGPSEILRHDVDGLLVPQDDHVALVDALASLMSDKALRNRYATRAIEARERFALERVAMMWEELFVLLRSTGSA